MDRNYDYELAMARLDAEPELDAHRETISTDWREIDHWRWIAEAPVAEIVAWAEEIEANAQ